MTLTLEDKKAIVADVEKLAKASHSALVADYRGLKVVDMTVLRAKARERGVHCRVVRNTLAKIALKGSELECLSDALTGTTILAFSSEELGAAARLFRDFIEENEGVTVKKLAVQGQAYGPEQLEAIASLPTRDEALAMLMSVMKAPITKFVRTAAEPAAKFVRTVQALHDQKASAT